MATNTTTIVLLLLLFLFLNLTLSISTTTQSQEPSRRNMAFMEDTDQEEDPPLKPPPKKKTNLETKNQTKLIKPTKPKKSNSTTTTTTITTTPKIKLNKTLTSTPKPSNSTKLPKPIKPIKSNSTKTTPKSPNSTTTTTTTTPKIKLNKTLTSTPKPSNSTKLPKPIKPIKSNSTKTTTKSPNSTTTIPSKIKPKDPTFPPKNKTLSTTTPKSKIQQQPTTKKPTKKKQDDALSWLEQDTDSDGGEDLIAEFRGLPSRLLPDLQRLSVTSKSYISRANKGIADGVKPYVGHRYAPAAAASASAFLLALPLLLLTLLFHRLRAYLSLHRLLVFIQAYLAIYFATLAVTAVATGLEPLRFFYAASPSSYACTQAMQTLAYVLYLLAQMVHLVAVFSSPASGGADRALGLAQMVVGLVVGMHYYAVVFHRAAAGEPPRANWKVHGVYAACFLVICGCARAERRKKEYLPVDGGDGDGKKS